MTDKELIGKLDAMVKALQKAKKKTDKTRILLDARKDFGDEDNELMFFFRFLLTFQLTDSLVCRFLGKILFNQEVLSVT